MIRKLTGKIRTGPTTIRRALDDRDELEACLRRHEALSKAYGVSIKTLVSIRGSLEKKVRSLSHKVIKANRRNTRLNVALVSYRQSIIASRTDAMYWRNRAVLAENAVLGKAS